MLFCGANFAQWSVWTGIGFNLSCAEMKSEMEIVAQVVFLTAADSSDHSILYCCYLRL